jgi:hypothetical protein
MPAILTVQFTPMELNWLQANIQAFNEEKSPQMGSDDENHSIGGDMEHPWFQDFLMKVRQCIGRPNSVVLFTDVDQLNFIKKWFTDYKNTSGEYMFQGGPYGSNIGEGSQFPSVAGQNPTGEGSFGQYAFQESGNIFNDILHKLGEVIYPVNSPIDHSPGGV